MNNNEEFIDVLIKGGHVVKEDHLGMFKKYVSDPNFGINDYVDMEIALDLIDANNKEKISTEKLQSILENTMRNTYDREVWRTQILDQILEYTEGMVYNLGEDELGRVIHGSKASGFTNQIYENLKSELEQTRRSM